MLLTSLPPSPKTHTPHPPLKPSHNRSATFSRVLLRFVLNKVPIVLALFILFFLRFPKVQTKISAQLKAKEEFRILIWLGW